MWSEEVLDFVVGLDGLTLEDNLVEIVFLELVDLDSHLKQVLVEEVVVSGEVILGEGDVVQLANVGHVEDCEALFEFVWQLLHVLPVADR